MLKRAFDLLFATAGLAAGAPLLAATAVAIKLESEGPVFYRGRRVGKGGRVFHIFKFRSMVINAEEIGGPTTSGDDPRVTQIGKMIRRFKLDELPQLINVITGDMSLVGPRPDVESEIQLLSHRERKLLLSVRPGITDWASLENHDEGETIANSGIEDPHEAYRLLIQPEKLRLQLKYVNHHNLKTDIEIIFRTLAKLVRTRT